MGVADFVPGPALFGDLAAADLADVLPRLLVEVVTRRIDLFGAFRSAGVSGISGLHQGNGSRLLMLSRQGRQLLT